MYLPVERSYVLSDLRRSTIEVIFDKENGDRRTMRCTLHEGSIPPDRLPVEQPHPSEDRLVVWDVDAQDFRSFKLNRIISLQLPTTV